MKARLKTPLKKTLILCIVVFAIFIVSLFFLGDAPAYPIGLTFIAGIGAIVYAIYDSKS